MGELKAVEYKRFEDIRHVRPDGREYWRARELAHVLDYTQWRNFARVVSKAMIACQNSGYAIGDHFAEASKTIKMPKSAEKKIADYELSRYACYLTVQNGDPRKEVIALGQTYFAIQTRRREVADYFNQLDEDNKRLVIRGDVKKWNQMLAGAAHNAGLLTNEEYAVFQNSGYNGLYGGLDVSDIHERKGLRGQDKILDFMGSEELAANLFRITQTESKLKRDNIQGAAAANATHYVVGREVRATIERVGGTMPENLPTPEKSISEIEKKQIAALRKKRKRLMLDE